MQALLFLYCDKISVLHLTINPVFHTRTKHVEIDYHYVHEQVALRNLKARHVSTIDQPAENFYQVFEGISIIF